MSINSANFASISKIELNN